MEQAAAPKLNYAYNQVDDLPIHLRRTYDAYVKAGLDSNLAFEYVTGHGLGGTVPTTILTKVDHIEGYEGVDIGKLGVHAVDPELTLEMPKVADTKMPWTNSEGYLRSPALFWGKIYELRPDLFDSDNIWRLEHNLSPFNNGTIRSTIETLDVPESPLTDILHHHHIGGGGQAGPLPSVIHLGRTKLGINSTRTVETQLGITNYWER